MSPGTPQQSSCVNKWHITVRSDGDTDTLPKLSVYHRRILAHVGSSGGSMSTVQLARLLATERADSSGWRDSSNAVSTGFATKSLQEVYLELVTEQLPLLERKGLVNHCEQSGEISLKSSSM